MASVPKIPKRLVTQELQKIMAAVCDLEPDGTPITYARKISMMIVNRALGYWSDEVDKHGNKTRVYHPPDPEFVKLAVERYEGKPVQMADDEVEATTVDQKVAERMQDRLNKAAAKVTEDFVLPDLADANKNMPE